MIATQLLADNLARARYVVCGAPCLSSALNWTRSISNDAHPGCAMCSSHYLGGRSLVRLQLSFTPARYCSLDVRSSPAPQCTVSYSRAQAQCVSILPRRSCRAVRVPGHSKYLPVYPMSRSSWDLQKTNTQARRTYIPVSAALDRPLARCSTFVQCCRWTEGPREKPPTRLCALPS